MRLTEKTAKILAGYTPEKFNEKAKAFDDNNLAVLSADEVHAMKELSEKVKDSEVDLRVRKELAEIVQRYVTIKREEFDMIPLLFDYENFGEFEEPKFIINEKGYFAFDAIRGGFIPVSSNYNHSYTLQWRGIGASSQVALEKIRTGKVTTITELSSDCREALKIQEQQIVQEELARVYNASAGSEVFVVGLTPENLKNAIRKVRANGGKDIIVLGDELALNDIYDFAGFTDEAKEEERLTGKIGKIHGATLMGLPRVENASTGELVYPDNRIMIIPKATKTGKKIGVAGRNLQMKTSTYLDEEPEWFRVKCNTSFDARVIFPQYAYVIQL